MKLFLINLFLFLVPILSPNYHQIFGDDYDEALFFLYKNKNIIKKISSDMEGDLAIITAIFFPELIRYSLISDFLETKVLEYVYIEKGKNYADFSIGRMQMKPSFIEKLEFFLQENQCFFKKSKSIYEYSRIEKKEIRKERLERLKSFHWQNIYINCFYQIMEYRFSHLNFKNKDEKIKFYATAYNFNFMANEKEIKKYSHKKQFPYGIDFLMEQYNYSDISVDFYKKYYSKIML